MLRPHVGMSHGPGVFSDEEFQAVAHEVVSPQISEYEFFVESYGTKFYRKYNQVPVGVMATIRNYMYIVMHCRQHFLTVNLL